MQRLFSMFPAGTAGAALLVLRTSVAATLIVYGTAHWAPVTSFWISLATGIVAISLCFGLFTPYCGAVSCVMQLYLLLIAVGSDRFHLTIAILDSGVLAFLGPGAYSVDARLFGRKRLTVHSRT